MFNIAQNQSLGILPLSTGLRNGNSVFLLTITGTLSASNALNGDVDGVAVATSTYTTGVNQFFADVVSNLTADANIKSAAYLGYDYGLNQYKVKFVSDYPNQLLLENFAISGGSTSPTVQISYQGGLTEYSGFIGDNVLQKRFETITLTGTATAGGASTITLAVGSSSVNQYYTGLIIRTTGGTGSGQVRYISNYVGSTRVATVNTAWAVQPDATTTYEIKYQFRGFALPSYGTDKPVWSIAVVVYNDAAEDSVQFNANGQGYIYVWDNRTDLLPLSVELYPNGYPYNLQPNTIIL